MNAARLVTTLIATLCSSVFAYCCTRETDRAVSGATATLRLPDGTYRLTFLKPADGVTLETRLHVSKGLGLESKIALPPFTNDLAMRIEGTQAVERTVVPGTQ